MRYYSMDSFFEDSMEAIVCGTFDHLDTKPNSFYYFLKNVSVHPKDQKQTFFFSDFLVIVSRKEGQILSDKSFQTVESADNIQPSQIPKIGNLLEITGTLYHFEEASNPGQFDEKYYYREQNLFYKMTASDISVKNQRINQWKQSLFTLRNAISGIYQKGMGEKNAGIVMAMLLGDKSLLDTEIKNLYQSNGIGHILAISGLHISILCMLFYQLFRHLHLPQPFPLLLTICFLLSYGTMAGFSISASRAIIMMLFLLVGRQIGRSYDALTALAFSAVCVLVQKPYAVCSASFLLSYSAVLGSIVTYPALKCFILGNQKEQKKRQRKQHRRLQEQKANSSIPGMTSLLSSLLQKTGSSFLFSIAIWLTTLPVVLYFFYEIPTYGILLNLLILPLVSLVLIFSMLGGIIGLFCFPLGSFFLFLTEMLLNGYEFLCRLFQMLPNPVQIWGRPSFLQIFLYGAILGGLIIYGNRIFYCPKNLGTACRFLSLFLVFTALFLLHLQKPLNKLSVTTLDVGQGDAIILRTENHKTILIDGGSTSVSQVGTYRILPFLKYYGISKIDYMIMTHSDEDHISGQLELMQNCHTSGVSIGCYLMPSPAKECRGSNYTVMQNAACHANIPIRYLQTGDWIQTGKLRLLCLHPDKGFVSDSVNAYSTVLSLSYGSFRMLLTGDLEKNGEDALYEKLTEAYDALKVAHHGSKNSTSQEFLERITPKVSLISCGKRNQYGHPHKELLDRLDACHSQVYQTAKNGAVELLTDGEGFLVNSYYSQENLFKQN